MLARAHKKFQLGRHAEIYLLTLKEQDKTKIEFPLDMVSISASSCRTNPGCPWTSLHYACFNPPWVDVMIPHTVTKHVVELTSNFNLRQVSLTYKFSEPSDEVIRDRRINKCLSKEPRSRLLREPDTDLAKLLTISRAFEQSDFQAQEMEQPFRQLSESSNTIDVIRLRESLSTVS